MSRIRIVPVLVILVVAFSLLFGGWELYNDFGLVRPLEQQLMQDHAVTHVKSLVDGQQREVQISLKKVSDLQTTYENLQKTVDQSMGYSVEIQLIDNRTAELSQAYRDLQPILYSGMAKGDFQQMITDATRKTAQAGIHTKISMNDQDIFVQMEKGGHYLYEVLPYKNSTSDLLKEVLAQ